MTIDNSEDVARTLFFPSFFNNASSPFYSEQVLSPTAFKLQILKSGTPESSVSVLRIAVDSFMHDLAMLSPRQTTDMKCGFAVLNVGEIREIHIQSDHLVQIEVIASPSKRLRSHAEIIFRMDGSIITATDEPLEIIRFRKKLARLASQRITML